MSTEPAQFDDPGLKAALRTLQSGQAAPGGLHDRVRQRLAEARREPKAAAAAAKSSVAPGAVVEPVAAPTIARETAPPLQPRNPNPIKPRSNFRIGQWVALAATIAICVGGGMTFLHYRHMQEEKEE